MKVYENDIIRFRAWNTPKESFAFKTYDDALNKALDLSKNGAETVWIDVSVMNQAGDSGFTSTVSILRGADLTDVHSIYKHLRGSK